MKTADKFLKDKLVELFNNMEGIKIRYEYEDYMNLHLVEILPLEAFENNEELILKEIKIQDEFEKLFGNKEELLFISSDSLNQITNSDFSLGHEVNQVSDLKGVK